jgi:hypothetical protein
MSKINSKWTETLSPNGPLFDCDFRLKLSYEYLILKCYDFRNMYESVLVYNFQIAAL